MRALRWIAVTVFVWALVAPATANANGGAFIDFRGGGSGSHHLIGDPVTGVTYVAVPKDKQDLFERGPFYAFLLREGAFLTEGRPIPADAIRLGTFTFAKTRDGSFALRTSFTVPSVPGGFYSVQLCNDPCTISGFRESLSGDLSIVATEREADLLRDLARQDGRMWRLRRDVRQAGRANEELQTTIDTLQAERDTLASEVDRLETESTAAVAAAAEPSEGRPLVDAWALVAVGAALIVALLAIALAVVFGRRHARFVAPETPETPEGLEPDLHARVGSNGNGEAGADSRNGQARRKVDEPAAR